MDIAIIADPATLKGFEFAGVSKAFVAKEKKEDIILQFEDVKKDKNVGMLILTEKVSENLRELLVTSKDIHFSIVEIPDKNGRMADETFIETLVRKVMGTKKEE